MEVLRVSRSRFVISLPALLAGMAPVAWAVAASGLAGCGGAKPAAVSPGAGDGSGQGSGAAGAGTLAVDEAALDKSVSPCDDFYRYACGSWQKATPIPDDEANWSRSFSTIHKQNEETLRGLLEGYAKGERASDAYAKELGVFYASCMDTAAIDAKGLAPLKETFAHIDAVKDAASFAKAVAHLGTLGIDAPFGFSGDQDLRDASIVIGHIDQGGLGLPDKDYYLTEDAKKKEVRTKYQEHMQRLFVLLGDKPDTAKKNAATVMKIETLLAKASMSREERRDPKKLHNRLERSGLAKAAPTIAWDQFLTGVGAKDLQTINVLNPTFIKAVDGMVKSVPAGEWRTYFRAHTVHALADALPTGFQEEGFRMRSALLGLAKQPERWKRCVRAADHAMGEALGQGFAKATLGSEGKAKTRSMIAAIEKAMEQNLGALPWMDEATRARAAQKLASITNKVAYPDKWRNYDALTIASGEHAHNVMRANVFEFERRVARIGKPVDRDEWGMTPPTVNAYYNPLLNEMVFPAGILQPPFYSNNFTTPTNYGAIGMVMGHELTHGFDDEGRQFDAKGNLSDWWTPPVNAEFEKRASCVEKQFSSYVAIGEERINGKLTLGENIADLGGIKLAYAAMRAELGKTANTSESTVGGFSADQQLFLGFAQSWCSNEREQWLRMRLAADPHSPARFRVNGPLSNMKEFAAAFQCKSGDKMVREGADRCEVW